MNPVTFVAEKVGTLYRGEVIDSRTYKTLRRTATAYSSDAEAKEAAKRVWGARELRGLATAALIALVGSVAHAGTFARNDDAYCQDLGETAARAAHFRDEGHAYSAGRAINGYRPERHDVDFDKAFDRKKVAKAVFEGTLSGEEARAEVVKACESGEK